jgi:hypothetical protein
VKVIVMIFLTPFYDRNRARMLFCCFTLFLFNVIHFSGTFFQLSFSVQTQSVLCTVFNVLARQDKLKRVSIHTVCPCFSRGSTSFGTMALVLLMSAVIKGA